METTTDKKKWLRQSTVFLKQKKYTWTRISFEDITYIEASNESSIIHFMDKNIIHCSYSLFELQSHLPYGFERVHKSYIINMAQIKHLDAINKKIFFANNEHIPVGGVLRKNITKHLLSRTI